MVGYLVCFQVSELQTVDNEHSFNGTFEHFLDFVLQLKSQKRTFWLKGYEPEGMHT